MHLGSQPCMVEVLVISSFTPLAKCDSQVKIEDGPLKDDLEVPVLGHLADVGQGVVDGNVVLVVLVRETSDCGGIGRLAEVRV